MLKPKNSYIAVNEFYDRAELDWYLDNMRNNLLDEQDAIDYLYSQTVLQFRRGESSDIETMILRYFNHNGLVSDQE